MLRGDTSAREKRIVLTAFYAQRGRTAAQIADLIGVKISTVRGYGRDFGIGIIDCRRQRGATITSGWLGDGA